MFVRSVTKSGIYPNIHCISGPTGKIVTNYGKLYDGKNIQIDNFIMNGKVLRKDYYVWSDSFRTSFHKVWDKVTGKFKKAHTQYDKLEV